MTTERRTTGRRGSDGYDGDPSLLRSLPNNLEAERAVLGSILLHPDVLETIETLQADHFFRDAHRRIFAAMVTLREAGSAIDLITIREELRRTGELDDVGGAAYIAALVDGMPRAANAAHYAAIVVDHAQRRRAISIANKLTTAAYEADEPVADVVLPAAESLGELMDRSSVGQVYRLRDVVKPTMERIESAMASTTGLTGISTGFADLDAATAGLQASDLVIVAARTSVGKTSFALSVTRNVAAPGGVALVHSCEMSKEQLFIRLLSAEARIDSRRLATGNLSPAEWSRVAAAIDIVASMAIFIDDTPSVTCLDILARARKVQAEEGQLNLVVVDYLQLMRGHGKFENRTQEVSSISRGLKGIAKKLRVPLMALSQLKRPPDSRQPNRRPVISDLRESGDIENDADVVLLLYRPDDDPSTAEVIIGKQRNGPTISVKLAFIDYCTRFQNLVENVPA